MKTFLLCSLIGTMSLIASTEVELRKDISNSVKHLSTQRAEQAKQQPVIGAKVAELERELLTLRRQHSIARLGADGRKELHAGLARDVQKFDKDAHYMRGLYRDFSVQLGAHLHPGHKGIYGEKLDVALKATSTLNSQSSVLDTAMDQLESLLGGETITADVVGEDGRVLSGKVANVGPASWFISSDGETAGVIVHEKGASHARLINENSDQVKALFASGKSELSIDLTGGKARAIAQVQGSSNLLKKGGVWLIPILSIALISAICGVIKLLQLLKIKEPSSGWMAEILTAVRAGDTAEAEQIASRAKHPVSDLIKTALNYTSAGADVVEEVIYEQLIGVQSQLQKWLPFIAVTAATAPLLGLLGTVSGMISMFNVITVTGTGDVKPMAGGISEALVTTLFGLIVAIPALIIHTMLSRRSNGVVQTTEKLGLTFVNGLRKLK